jgi:hypothetical protein
VSKGADYSITPDYSLSDKCTAQTGTWQLKDLNSSGQVTGGGTPPKVEYVWVLPDEDPTTAGTQIWPKPSAEREDLYACVVASDPNGRDDLAAVFIDIYHPTAEPECGSQEYQLHGVMLDIVSQKEEIEACKTAALNAGLITPAEFTDINYNIFEQREWYMYKVDLKSNYCQPAGDYEARTYAVDREGGVSIPKSAYYTWIQSVILQIDFYNGVNYGELIPGVEQTVQGDGDMSTPAAPTMKNEGNVPIEITLNNSKMIGALYRKEIVDYDAKFRDEHLNYKAGDKITFEDSLELCNTRKIDFSVMALYGTPIDIYTGNITIYVEKGTYENNCGSTTTTTTSTTTTTEPSHDSSTTTTSTTTTTEPTTTSTTTTSSTTTSTEASTTSSTSTTSTEPTTTSSTTTTSTTTTTEPSDDSTTTTTSTTTTSTEPSTTSTTTTTTEPSDDSTTTTTTTSTTSSTEPSTTSSTTTSTTTTTSTVLTTTTSTTFTQAAEFQSAAWALAILVMAPALAYQAVNRKR